MQEWDIPRIVEEFEEDNGYVPDTLAPILQDAVNRQAMAEVFYRWITHRNMPAHEEVAPEDQDYII